VQNDHDSGADSLRQAILGLCPGGVIGFAGDTTIYLASPLVIDKQLTIDGGDYVVTVSGNNAVRAFNIGASGVVTLSHLNIVSGTVGGISNGGGIYNSGTLTVTNSTLSGNSADGMGGGILNFGTLTVQNSTLANNSSAAEGGGIYNFYGRTLTVQDSTLSGNSAISGDGGGIFSRSLSGNTLTVQDSTFYSNTANNGGGIASGARPTLLTNTALYSNTAAPQAAASTATAR
jgi:hypothetical protein